MFHGQKGFRNCTTRTNLHVSHLDWHFVLQLGQFMSVTAGTYLLQLGRVLKTTNNHNQIQGELGEWQQCIWFRQMAWHGKREKCHGWDTFKGLGTSQQYRWLRHMVVMYEEKVSRLGTFLNVIIRTFRGYLDIWRKDRIFKWQGQVIYTWHEQL